MIRRLASEGPQSLEEFDGSEDPSIDVWIEWNGDEGNKNEAEIQTQNQEAVCEENNMVTMQVRYHGSVLHEEHVGHGQPLRHTLSTSDFEPGETIIAEIRWSEGSMSNPNI